MFKKVFAMALIFSALSLTGCDKITGLFGGGGDPKTVANKFWAATKTGQVEKMKPFVTANSLQGDMIQNNTAKTEGEYTLGTPAIQGDKATIPTTLKDKGFNIELQTICVKENGQWRVDVPQTMMTMFGGAMAEVMKGMGEGMKKMGETMGEAVAGETKSANAAPTAGSPKTLKTGDKIQVEWHGAWYPATVLEIGSNKWKIHYEGYDNSWDEWVEPNRVK